MLLNSNDLPLGTLQTGEAVSAFLSLRFRTHCKPLYLVGYEGPLTRVRSLNVYEYIFRRLFLIFSLSAFSLCVCLFFFYVRG